MASGLCVFASLRQNSDASRDIWNSWSCRLGRSLSGALRQDGGHRGGGGVGEFRPPLAPSPRESRSAPSAAYARIASSCNRRARRLFSRMSKNPRASSCWRERVRRTASSEARAHRAYARETPAAGRDSWRENDCRWRADCAFAGDSRAPPAHRCAGATQRRVRQCPRPGPPRLWPGPTARPTTQRIPDGVSALKSWLKKPSVGSTEKSRAMGARSVPSS